MSLSYRIAIMASVLTAAVMVVIGTISYLTSRTNITENAVQALDYEASLNAQDIAGRLAVITETFLKLADNTVVFNALIDSAGRETYLLPFFQGFSEINGIPVRVSLVDFQGVVVAQTGEAISTAEQREWLRTSIGKGRSASAIFPERDGQFLVMVHMLLYPRTKTVEGALLFKLPMAGLLPSQRGEGDRLRELELIVGSGAAASTQENLPAIKSHFVEIGDQTLSVIHNLHVDAPLAGLGLTIKVTRSAKSLKTALKSLFYDYLAIGVASILLMLGISWWAGLRLTRPLRELEALATSIVDTDSSQNRFIVTGYDEINRVGIAFNRMLDRLRDVYDELRGSASQLTTLVESMPDPVFILNRDGKELAVLGPSVQQGVGRRRAQNSIGARLSALDQETLLEAIGKAIDDGVTKIFEYQHGTAATGSERWFEARITPLPEDFGIEQAVMCLVRDITERKSYEERLGQSQKMEAIGQLTGGVAHDFNNLLAVMMGNAEILDREFDGKHRSTQAILRAAKRGSDLTQRLLAFSRQQPLRPQPIDCNALVESMTDMLSRTLGETIELRMVRAMRLYTAMGDTGQVENAILNLAINAKHAMPGGGELVIETSNHAVKEGSAAEQAEVSPGEYVRLAVKDTGAGMSPEILERVFDPFFTTKDVGEGSGLGLSMVYGFAKQSGGFVTIESEEGVGTIVELYLPRAEMVEAHATEIEDEEEPLGHGETVLIVEDDADVRDLAVLQLKSLGYNVVTAADGKAGLKAWKDTSRIDLILADVVLSGGMSGPQLVEKIIGQRPEIKVLFVSGYAETALHGHNGLGRDTPILSKPFKRAELAFRIREALESA